MDIEEMDPKKTTGVWILGVNRSFLALSTHLFDNGVCGVCPGFALSPFSSVF